MSTQKIRPTDVILSFIHSFILETYIAPLQETTTQRCSQPIHGQKRRTSERCKIWKGGPSARNATQRGDHSMLMDPQPKRAFFSCKEVGLFCTRISSLDWNKKYTFFININY